MKTIFAILVLVALTIAQSIPREYDTRKLQNPNCAVAIRNQGKCGSCWAFCMTTSLSERFCQLSKGRDRPMISPQYVVNCDKSNSGCNGGRMISAFNFVAKNGAPEDSCIEYYSGNTTKEGKCPKTCDDGSKMNLWYAIKGYSIRSRDVAAMQKDIIQYGPITVGYYVYDDFKPFFEKNPTGIYTRKSGTSLLGGHGVALIGWGEENGTPYWIAHNSWGATWGDKGYFKIKRGVNECGIESMMIAAGLPKIVELPEYAIPLDVSSYTTLNAPIEHVRPSPRITRIADFAMLQAKMINNEIPRVTGVSRVTTQVVAGIIYEFDLNFERGAGKLRVYEKPSGELEILDLLY
jgi:cathepsin B